MQRILFTLMVCCSFSLFGESLAKELAKKVSVKTGKALYSSSDLYPLSMKRWVRCGVHKVGLTLQGYKEEDMEAARRDIIDAAREYLAVINGEKMLRPYLCRYPFLERHIELEICFVNRSLEPVGSGAIASVVLDEGMISYYQKISEYTDRLVHRESVESAKQLLDLDS